MSKHAKRLAGNVATSDESRSAATHPEKTSIAALAYQLWLERGCPIGSDQDDWFRAEAMLKSRSADTVEELAASAGA